MADLFGNWVPAQWIETVLDIARQADQWNFLMLTKFPQRMAEFEFPANVWCGTTVDCQARVANAERALRRISAPVKWLSLEPLIEKIEIDFSLAQWVVIGGASASTQTPEWKPPRRWVIDLTNRAMDAGCKVYHKTNLNDKRLREYPGFEDSEPTLAPSPFHYLRADASRIGELLDLGSAEEDTWSDLACAPGLDDDLDGEAEQEETEQ
jgi:protein gp37